MPKRYGVKEKDQVVAHILDMLLSGRLRTGDRVDRNEITAALGLSRVPVQEALGQLEHDGILVTQYHRGAFVQRFDAEVLREHHEVHALLVGAAFARAAADRRPAVLELLDDTVRALRDSPSQPAFLANVDRYREILVDTYAGPRLQAAIKASRSFMPGDFWLTYPRTREVLQPFVEEQIAAVRAGQPDKVRRTALDCLDVMADLLIEDLYRRGVFTALDSP